MTDPDRIWKPHVTVAAVVERGGRFLLVEEDTDEGRLFNQPAGHLDPGESLLAAVARETLEETRYEFQPEALLGVYHHCPRPGGPTYLRFAYTGRVEDRPLAGKLDTGIVRADWFTVDEVRQTADRHRTMLVLKCIEDYIAGQRYPLHLVQTGSV